MDARTGANINNIIRRAHRVLIMLYHNKGIAEVSKPLHGSNQLAVITLVQSNGRLVENIKHPHKVRADLGCKPNTLAFTARKGLRVTEQCEILKSYAL